MNRDPAAVDLGVGCRSTLFSLVGVANRIIRHSCTCMLVSRLGRGIPCTCVRSPQIPCVTSFLHQVARLATNFMHSGSRSLASEPAGGEHMHRWKKVQKKNKSKTIIYL
jgi:hypothetical protein